MSAKKKLKYTPETACVNCGGLHFGSINCPYAVPFDDADRLGVKRGLAHTCSTANKLTAPQRKAGGGG